MIKMKIFREYTEVDEFAPFCVALGSFDGVHKGHLRLMEALKQNSETLGTRSMIYTFSNHPRKILAPDMPTYLITNNEKRAAIIGNLGIDVLFLEDFRNVMNMEAEAFIRKVLIDKFKVRCVIIGYNYRFGRCGEGCPELMKEFGDKYGFKVEVIPAVEVNGETVSSSLIRHIIKSGEVDRIIEYLGRDYSIKGTVVYGKQNGTAMGIRTANLEIDKDMILPKRGVYMTSTVADGKTYKSVTNVGYNSTFNGERLSVETHLIDFTGDIYENQIEVFFLKRIRDEIKFPNVQELVTQIMQDIESRLSYKCS